MNFRMFLQDKLKNFHESPPHLAYEVFIAACDDSCEKKLGNC